MARTAGYVDGSELMLFVDTSTGGATATYKPTLAAKSHKVSYKTSTKEIVTKDTVGGKWKHRSVSSVDVSISVDALTRVGEATNGVSDTELMKMLKDAKSVKLRFGFKASSTGDTCEEGLFVVTALDQTSNAGEETSYSATFENDGEVKTITLSTSGITGTATT